MMSADNVSPLARSDLLLVLGIGIAMVVILNLIPILFTLVERFFTLTHELGHLIATVLTGGKTKGIRVYYKPHNGAAGEAFREGGVSPLIYPAGYLGTAIFSAILLLLSGLTSIASYTLLALGLLLILSAFSAGRNFFTRLIGFLLVLSEYP